MHAGESWGFFGAISLNPLRSGIYPAPRAAWSSSPGTLDGYGFALQGNGGMGHRGDGPFTHIMGVLELWGEYGFT